jgi:hypothetical protein
MSPAEQRHEDARRDPPFTAAERAMLEAWLEFHRATLLIKCAGLTDEQLKTRSVPPSSLSLLGLVRHLTEVEANWFRRALVTSDPQASDVATAARRTTRAATGDDFDDVETADPAADLARFHHELDHSRRVAAEQQDLDTIGTGFRGGRDVAVSLRWIYVHMIEEYVRHNGHADLLRERIDGSTGA